MYPPPPQAAGTPPPTGGASGPRAGFWRRFVGALIDGILLGIVSRLLDSAAGQGGGTGLGLLVSLAYFTVLIGSDRGQTLGQMAMGIRVIDFNGGGSIGYGRALIRWLVSIVSAL
ncbi:MAG TPA: RDD family protein, partial [Gaiellaceae bacterium]